MQLEDVRHRLPKHPRKQYKKRALASIKHLVIHHSGTQEGDAFSFARYHVHENDWPGIGYHYVILKDGTIQWANDLEVVSYHVQNHNPSAVGICLVGDFRSDTLISRQKTSLQRLCQFLLIKLSLCPLDIQGHNELSRGNTECPALDMDELRHYLAKNFVEIYLGNEKLDVSGIIKEDTTFVALRPFAEQLGYKVLWDEKKRRIYLKSNF